MKTIKMSIAMIALVVLASCGFGRRHTTIVENTDGHYLKIEYAGHISFSDDETTIRSISRGGYVKYENNDKKLEAKNDRHGGISYELYEGDTKLNLDENGKRFIADAVRIMVQKAGRDPNFK